jgi:hypothetical protein
LHRLEFITNIKQPVLINVVRHLYHRSLTKRLSCTRDFNLLPIFNHRLSQILGPGTIRTYSLPSRSLELSLVKHDVPLVEACLRCLSIFPQPVLFYLALSSIFSLQNDYLLRRARCNVRVLCRVFYFFCSDLFRLPHRNTAILLDKKRGIGPVVEGLRVLI